MPCNHCYKHFKVKPCNTCLVKTMCKVACEDFLISIRKKKSDGENKL
jgi:hypothetical protein